MERLIDMTTHDPAQDWKQWHEQRTATVSAPYGLLSLTGTHWIADAVQGRVQAVPGHWAEDSEDGGALVLTAAGSDGLTLDGAPFEGTVRLAPDSGPPAASRLALGERRLVVLRPEGDWAVRAWDPESPARQAFAGIEATPYDEKWALPGSFTPYDESRTVRVANADGRSRGLGLGGELAFTLDGTEHTLQVTVEPDGGLWAVFADATSGDGTFRFRFLRPGIPAADGTLTVDFNRALLPPCAFGEHFICPFPPPGNTLGFGIPAGERRIAGH
jgi:uncharacterized protein (DUF1684 family)